MSASSALSVKSADPMTNEPPPLPEAVVFSPAAVVGEELFLLLPHAASTVARATGKATVTNRDFLDRFMVLLVLCVWVEIRLRILAPLRAYEPRRDNESLEAEEHQLGGHGENGDDDGGPEHGRVADLMIVDLGQAVDEDLIPQPTEEGQEAGDGCGRDHLKHRTT